MTETIQTRQEVSIQRIEDLLCNAFEGGSNYWYVIARREGPCGGNYLAYAMSEDSALIVRTIENDEINGAKEWRLDLAACKRGLEVMAAKYPRHYANFVSENDDAETGDVFLQCCLFGEIVFG